MTEAEAFGCLGLPVAASLAEVKAAWRELATVRHPDHGGSAEQFHELREAYQLALEAVKSRPCTVCHGQGSVTVAGGFTSLRLPCQHCGGSRVEPLAEL